MEETKFHATHSRNPLATFAPWPEKMTFAGREKGENIILMLRAHVITLVPVALEVIGLAIVPIILFPILAFLKVDILGVLSAVQIFLAIVIWYFFTFGYVFYKFIFWYFNVYLLTNERIVDFDFKGVLHRETAYANLAQIEDVTPKSIGIFSTFFHFGNVFIQTAAQKPEFEFHHVPNPNDVAREILEQIRKEEGEAPGEIK